MSKSAYIVDIVRTPVGKFGGTLATMRPDDMAAWVIRDILLRNKTLDPALIEDVILGAANQAGEDNRNVARMAALLAGLPIETGGVTVNRLCASGLQSIMDASRAIMLNEGVAYLAGGTESMSRAPFVVAKSETAYGRSAEMYDTTIGWRFTNPALSKMYYPFAMGETAENVADKWKISREEQDAFAHQSQQRYIDDDTSHVAAFSRPDPQLIAEQLATLKKFKADRSQSDVQKALDGLSEAAATVEINLMEKIVNAADAGVTQGEICTRLRDELGFGHPLITA